MLLSLALILMIGFALSMVFTKVHLPGILGMIVTGILMGPYVLNLISPEILMISSELREIALIVILTRAGLNLDLKDLKAVGRPALMMCFIPAIFEMTAITLVAPVILGVSYFEAAVMATIIAAVSPAIIVPRMIYLMETGYGRDKKIPHLIMAGASVDDIFVIVLFGILIGFYQGNGAGVESMLNIPISIGLGLLVGVISGKGIIGLFHKISMRDTMKTMMVLSVSFLLVTLQNEAAQWIPISGLLAVMVLGIVLLHGDEEIANRLKSKFSKMWVGAEIMLFVLVGAAVDINIISGVGLPVVALLSVSLIFRGLGVMISLIKTPLNIKERFFCILAYLPKATVQAAIGAIPLTLGMPAGGLILAVAVMTIMLTAPLGAIGIDKTYKKWLNKSKDD